MIAAAWKQQSLRLQQKGDWLLPSRPGFCGVQSGQLAGRVVMELIADFGVKPFNGFKNGNRNGALRQSVNSKQPQ